STFEEGSWGGFHNLLGVSQAELWLEGTDGLDSTDLVRTSTGQNDVKFSLFFSGSATTSGRHHASSHYRSGRYTKFFFQSGHEFAHFHQREFLDGVHDLLDLF